MKELAAIVRELTTTSATEGAVLATLVAAEGSSYRRPGARLIVTPDGRRIGSISGGCLEEDVLARAAQVSRHGRAEVVVYDTTSENDLIWGVGLGCHGVVHVLLEKLPVRPSWAFALAQNMSAQRPSDLTVLWSDPSASTANDRSTLAMGTFLTADIPAEAAHGCSVFRQRIDAPTSLLIFGAGDDAQPLCRMASDLGWRVTVADPRPAFATKARFPEATELTIGPSESLVEVLQPKPATLAVVMTHHYVHDVPVLRGLLARPLAYLGVLGPKQRTERILSDLTKEGVSMDATTRERLHGPVGLDLGADGPEEVALSILAEMQASLSGRNARPLRERHRPIHE